MNIILSDETANGETSERSFEKPVIVIGRDISECDIAFDGARFPMVSRRHADLRWLNGGWLLTDNNSTYGTYVNGARAAPDQPLAAGDSLRFGTDGPVVRVVWFESEIAATRQPKPLAAERADPEKKSKAELPTETTNSSLPTTTALLHFESGKRLDFPLTKPQVWLGRDPSCDVVFDSSSVTVSRKHAVISAENNRFFLTDNGSFNGTFVNGERISSKSPITFEDLFQLGLGGPVVRLVVPPEGRTGIVEPAQVSDKTEVFRLDHRAGQTHARSDASKLQLLMSFDLGVAGKALIGRDAACDIRLDGLQISKRHAQIVADTNGFTIEDLGSTNGVFVNGERISRRVLSEGDLVQIDPFQLRVDAAGTVSVLDARANVRVDAFDLSRTVKDAAAGGKRILLDSISLSIQPNEFVGIIGPSGSGKSTLIEALNGVRQANTGRVLINNQDLYRNFEALKQSIGYVPQEDIIHRELSVYRTLYYVAKLRLARDVSSAEIDRIVGEVLDVAGLLDKRRTAVAALSGGQRKRVSTAVELITKPSVVFLDEPTSGLDPAAELNMMRLFREIAASGRTVVMTTHAMANVLMFDRIAILVEGKLAFFGEPDKALEYFEVADFKRLFEALGENAGEALHDGQAIARADGLKQRYLRSAEYSRYINTPQQELAASGEAARTKKRRLGLFGAVRQWFTLAQRYSGVLFRDKLNLLILLAQGPVIALLTFLVIDASQPRDFIYFVLALVSFWFGISISAREIVRERTVFRRERMFNLGLLPYLWSKLFVLGILVTAQCAFLFLPLKLLDLSGLMRMPGEWLGLSQFWIMLLTGAVGLAAGLFISAIVRTQELATSIVPLVLIPQILFSGIVGVPHGAGKVVGLTTPSAWSFDSIKRFSTLDTLQPEGADPNGMTRGLGLYRFTESENEKQLSKARGEIESTKRLLSDDPDAGLFSTADMPEIPELTKLPNDLSRYVTFLQPSMNEVLNQIVLMLMFSLMVIASLVVMRVRDRFS